MPVVLPKSKRPVLSKSPEVLFIYGVPKVGKTGKVVELVNEFASGLHIDLEKGAKAQEGYIIEANNISEFNEILAQIRQETLELRKQPGRERDYLYDFLIIDTIDKLEEFAEKYCTLAYNTEEKKRAADKKEKPEFVRTVTDLAYGRGYGYLREEVKSRIDAARSVCKKLILVGHIKDKAIKEKKGIDIVDTEINLTGKVASIVTAYADAIGFVYRNDAIDEEGMSQLMISFECVGDAIYMGSRHAHLKGKRMPFDWAAIYPDMVPERGSPLPDK